MSSEAGGWDKAVTASDDRQRAPAASCCCQRLAAAVQGAGSTDSKRRRRRRRHEPRTHAKLAEAFACNEERVLVAQLVVCVGGERIGAQSGESFDLGPRHRLPATAAVSGGGGGGSGTGRACCQQDQGCGAHVGTATARASLARSVWPTVLRIQRAGVPNRGMGLPRAAFSRMRTNCD